MCVCVCVCVYVYMPSHAAKPASGLEGRGGVSYL